MKKFNTLKKNYEFKRVLNKGQYYYGKYIQFFIIKNKNRLAQCEGGIKPRFHFDFPKILGSSSAA